MWIIDWVVYAKRPFAGPEQVLEYLGRYTHRVALSNDRLVDHRDGRVRFRWKDYADADRGKVMTLDADEFRTRRRALSRCRDLLGQPPPEDAPPESAVGLLLRLTGVDLARCPVCRAGRMQITAIVVRLAAPPDTS